MTKNERVNKINEALKRSGADVDNGAKAVLSVEGRIAYLAKSGGRERQVFFSDILFMMNIDDMRALAVGRK